MRLKARQSFLLGAAVSEGKFGSRRQILDLSTARQQGSVSTCGFFARKGRCGREFRNLPHTSVLRFRKCGEKQRPADQTTVLRIRDLRFCWQKNRSCSRICNFSPHFRNIGILAALCSGFERHSKSRRAKSNWLTDDLRHPVAAASGAITVVRSKAGAHRH